jgi:hypothetical protein
MIEPYTIITASNNIKMLNDNLLKSDAVKSADKIIVQENYKTASEAYNDAIDRSETDLLIFTHQDVYLPPNWCSDLAESIKRLDMGPTNWGVLGAWGVSTTRKGAGFMFCNAFGKTLGHSFSEPKEVQTLDEVLLIFRKSSGLRFDENLKGFHLYGSDLCLTANSMMLKNYAVSAFCLHNSTNYHAFPKDFWSSYKYLRKKWIEQTPICTSCTTITRSMRPMYASIISRNLRRIIKGNFRKERLANPKAYFSEVLEGKSTKASIT